MKKYILSLLITLCCMAGMQARGVNFAITLTDDAGNIQTSTAVTLRLSVVATDKTLYVETHNTTSNPYGVVHVVLGEGSAVAGTWSDIDWAADGLSLKVERADSASTEYSLISQTSIGAVPYAYHAGIAESLALTSPDGTRWKIGADNLGNLVSQKLAPANAPAYGTVDYIFDMEALPTITLEISEAEWNQFLLNFDANPNNEECVHCDFYFDKYGEVHHLSDIGLRLRGNTSRVRPEGRTGDLHSPDGRFNHVHFGFRFQKFNKGEENLLSGTDRFNLRWFKEDPTYCHEMYGYDLMRRFGVYTAPRSSYCKVYLKIKEDEKPVYYGVYEMFECFDEQYLADQAKAGNIAGEAGYMWKGSWGSGIPANFSQAADWAMGIENVTLNPSETQSFTYDFKGKKKKLDDAKAQLTQFISELNSKSANDLRTWLDAKVDVDLLLREMACEVAIGHWDDCWANGNNYYMYFDIDGDGRMKFIPYDLDNTLGTSGSFDAATRNPLKWGESPLCNKVLSIPEYRSRYISYLRQLADPANDYIDPVKSAARIKKWHALINDFVDNDTHQDTRIIDRPASWGITPGYRILEQGTNNFFTVKINTINSISE